MPDLSISDDPFSTALDRAVAATGYTAAQFNEACDKLRWAQLTAGERVDLRTYWMAMQENAIWDAMTLRHQRSQMPVWQGWHWVMVPWSDEEKAAERRAFQQQVD